MTATAVPEIAEAGVRQLAAACIAFAAAAAVCVAWKYTFSRSSAQAVILALAGLGAVLLGRVALLEKLSGGAVLRRKASVSAQAALLVCVMLTICSEAYFYYSPDRAGKVAEYLSRAQIETQTAKDAAAAKELIDGALLQERTAGGGVTADPAGEAAAERAKGSGDGPGPFYRYSTDNPENNTSLLYGVSNTQYYWSLSNTNVSQFMNETGQLNQWVDMYDTLDNRTFLNEIAGIRYYLGNDTDALPFGYEKKEGYSYDNTDLWAGMDQLDRFSCDLYENTYALPFGFTTDRWISRADYEGMDIPARQEALMQGIVLEKDPGTDFGQTAPILTARSVPFNLVFDAEKVTAEGVPETADTAAGTSMMSLPACSFTQEGGEVLTFRFNGVQDCETYLYIRGLEYRPKDGQESRTMLRLPVTGYAGEEAAVSKLIGFSTPEDPWTTGRKDFLVNMGYKRIPPDRIELTFPAAGTFSFDSIEIVCQPMSAYPAQAQALAAEGMTELDIHEMGDSFATDRITGQVDVTGPKILCLQIPRTAGWTAYVDGMRAELLQADTMFSALLLAEGSHSIELRYQTPGLRLGAVISIGMLLLLLVFGVIYTIVSLLLHVREKRVEAVPEGTFREEITADSDREQAADKSSGRITQQPDPETADGKR